MGIVVSVLWTNVSYKYIYIYMQLVEIFNIKSSVIYRAFKI